VIVSLMLGCLSLPLSASAIWNDPTIRGPLMDGVGAMLDSMRNTSPAPLSTTPLSATTPSLQSWQRSATPFPSNDPWLAGLPYDQHFDQSFFQIPATALLRGRWIGQQGDGLWIERGWVRFYRGDDYQDGRYQIRDSVLAVALQKTQQVLYFQFAVRDDMLVLRSAAGTTFLYQRFRERLPDEELEPYSEQ
jgi:hypothetical protein